MNNNDVFAKKLGEVLANYYTKYKGAKKKGTISLLNEKLSQEIQQVLKSYELSKERHGK